MTILTANHLYFEHFSEVCFGTKCALSISKGESRLMKDKGTQGGQSADIQSVNRPYVEVPTLGRCFQKRGVYDDKLFFSRHRMTYTFISEDRELISLHYDALRHTLFYKGHDIRNLELNDVQLKHIEQFRTAILKDDQARDLVIQFDETLHHYLRERHVDSTDSA